MIKTSKVNDKDAVLIQITETVHGNGFTIEQAIENLKQDFLQRMAIYTDKGDECGCDVCTCGN